VGPDSSELVAVVVAVCALLVVGIAAGLTLLVIRLTQGASLARRHMTEQVSTLRHDVPGLRARIDHAASRVDRLREEWAATDQAVTDMTVTLASMRGSLERLTRGRLAMLIRGAGLVSKAAQLALLWR
jgi:hypothetical protein